MTSGMHTGSAVAEVQRSDEKEAQVPPEPDEPIFELPGFVA